MVMKKKSLLLLALIPLLASCSFTYKYTVPGLGGGGEIEDDDIDDAGVYNIQIWVDEKISDLTKTQVSDFVMASGGKYTINLTVNNVGEASAAEKMLQDVRNGADLFCFAQDQLNRLRVAGALAKITGATEAAVKADTLPDAIKAATINDSLYAFPITSDNGYFLYYDKSYFAESDIGNMTTLLAKCTKEKRLYFEGRSNGFYTASYFIATGCRSDWHIDEATCQFDSFTDDYDSDNGIIAAKGLKELDSDKVVADSSASKLGDACVALVSGIWNYEAAAKRLGNNLGCAPLPNFTVDGKDYHLGSFDGYKMLGVKRQTDAKKASVCRKLARYLSSEDCQKARFNRVKWGPANTNASKMPDVLEHPGLAALAEQHKYAIPQVQCPGNWFSALSTAAKSIKSGSSDADIANVLKSYKASIKDLLADE